MMLDEINHKYIAFWYCVEILTKTSSIEMEKTQLIIAKEEAKRECLC